MKGTFRAKARSWDLGKASTGTEQVAVYFEFSDPELNSEGGGITWYGFFSEKTWQRTVESLRHMGWTGDDVSQLAGLDGQNAGLDRNEVELVIDEEEYPPGSGKVTEKVRWVNRLGGPANKAPLAPEEAKTFGARMKEKIRAMDAAKGQKPAAKANGGGQPPPGRPEPPPMTDDDIPF